MTSLTVRFSSEFIVRVSEVIQRIGPSEFKLGTEILGPLFGTRKDGLVTALSFRAVPIHNLKFGRQDYFERAFDRLLASTKTDPQLAPLELIGWCSIRSADCKGLLESDTAFQNRRFPTPSDVAVVLRPQPQAGVTVELYARSPKGLFSAENCWCSAGTFLGGTPLAEAMDFPLQARGNFTAEQPRPKEAVEAADQRDRPPQIVAPSAPPRAPLSRWTGSARSAVSGLRSRSLSWVAAALVFTIAATSMFLGMLRAKSSIVSASTRRAVLSSNSAREMSMKVEAQRDERLLVTWDRHSSIIESAKYAILFIDDGPRHREIDFAPGEMAGGSILYRPASKEVSFRLEALQPDDSVVTERVRVLDGSINRMSNSRANLPEMPVAEHLPATTDSANPTLRPRDQRSADSRNGVDDQTVPAITLQSPIQVPKLVASIAPPPALSITTAPTASSLEFHSLPSAPPLPAVAAVTSSNLPLNGTEAKAAPDVAGKEAFPHAQLRSQLRDIKSGPVYNPPLPVKQALPEAKLPGRWDTYGIKQVEVDVKIDATGHVSAARISKTRANIPQLLAASVLNAAKQWTFQPAQMHGKAVASEHTIVFEFRPAGQ